METIYCHKKEEDQKRWEAFIQSGKALEHNEITDWLISLKPKTQNFDSSEHGI